MATPDASSYNDGEFLQPKISKGKVMYLVDLLAALLPYRLMAANINFTGTLLWPDSSYADAIPFVVLNCRASVLKITFLSSFGHLSLHLSDTATLSDLILQPSLYRRSRIRSLQPRMKPHRHLSARTALAHVEPPAFPRGR